MDKRAIKKQIRAAARRAGVRISRGDMKCILDAVKLIGAMPVAVEVIKEHDCPSDPEKQGNIGPGHCPCENEGDTCSRSTNFMKFGLALEYAKEGKRIARKGWNGKGQYVEIGTDFAYRTLDDNGVLVAHEDIGTNALVFVGTRGRQVGWLASQADMLADDWYIVE